MLSNKCKVFVAIHRLNYFYFYLNQESRLSSKHVFRAKLLCETVDFSNNFKMLHFHFDRWLYKTASGILVLIYILAIIAGYNTFEKTFYFILGNLLIHMSFSKWMILNHYFNLWQIPKIVFRGNEVKIVC